MTIQLVVKFISLTAQMPLLQYGIPVVVLVRQLLHTTLLLNIKGICSMKQTAAVNMARSFWANGCLIMLNVVLHHIASERSIAIQIIMYVENECNMVGRGHSLA